MVSSLSAPAFLGGESPSRRLEVRSFTANHREGVLADLRNDDDFVGRLTVKMYYQEMYLYELDYAREFALAALELLRDR